MDVTKMSIAVEIEGRPYFVAMQGVDIGLLVHVLSSIFPEKTLKVYPAPEGFKFENLSTLVNKA